MEQDNWSTIQVNSSDGSNKGKKPVEFEIDEQETLEVNADISAKNEDVEQDKPSVTTNFEVETPEELEKQNEGASVSKSSSNNEPEELDGIETRGAQKRIRQLIKQRKERDEELARLRLERDELLKTVQEKETQLSASFKNSIDSTETQLTNRIEQAKEVFRTAAESGDADKMLLAQEQMSRSYSELNNIQQQRQAWEEYNTRVQAAQQAIINKKQEQTPQYDPKALEWATRNNWFGQDQIMTAAALTVDAELKSEGYDPSDDEFYEEIDKRLQNKFPNKFAPVKQQPTQGQQERRLQSMSPSNSAQVVAGASRTPKTSSSSNKIKLTQEDVRLAQKWNIPLEKYAEEKLKVEQAAGEYTTVR